jgi:hypothetical protein
MLLTKLVAPCKRCPYDHRDSQYTVSRQTAGIRRMTPDRQEGSILGCQHSQLSTDLLSPAVYAVRCCQQCGIVTAMLLHDNQNVLFGYVRICAHSAWGILLSASCLHFGLRSCRWTTRITESLGRRSHHLQYRTG